MVATVLLLWPVADTGLVYPVAAAVLGGVFLLRGTPAGAARPRHRGPRLIRPMRLFHSCNLYLSLLFVAVAIDPLLR